MPSPNLNEVTEALARLVRLDVERTLGGISVTVSTLPPEKADQADDTRLNIYLHHVAQDMDGGNDLVRGGSTGPVPVANRPLALKLYYVLTAHGTVDFEEDSSGQQILLGWAMKALHDNPSIDAALTIGTVQVFPTLGDQQLHVVLRPVSPEEAVSFWSTDQVRTARLAAWYEVHTVLLPPEAPDSTPGVTSQVMVSVVPAGRPTLTTTHAGVRFALPHALGGGALAPRRSPAVVALKAVPDGDSRLSATGRFLGDGLDAALVLRGEATTGLGLPGDAVVLRAAENPDWGVSVQDTAVELAVRPSAHAATPGGTVSVELPPGTYTLAVRRRLETRSEDGHTGAVEIESNRQPFAVAPHVISASVDTNGHVVIAVEPAYDATSAAATPQIAIGGEIYHRAQSLTGSTADVGRFLVVDANHYEAVPRFDATLPGRTYPVRVSVNGVDSQPFWLEVA